MPLEQRGEVGEIDELQQVKDSDGNTAHAATDERLEDVRQQGENLGKVLSFEYTTSGTGPEPLPAHEIPDGADVLVTYKMGNTGVVFVGGADAQAEDLQEPSQGLTFGVNDTSAVYIRTPNAGDGVTVTAEVRE